MEKKRRKSRLAVITMIALTMIFTSAVPAFAAAPSKESVKYLGSGKVEVEFDEDVDYKKVKVTVKDTSGKKYKVSIYHKDDDELKFKIKKYKNNKKYKFTISGVREEGTTKYGKVTGSVKIPKKSSSISSSKAKSIALKDAGLSSSQVRDLDVEKEKKGGTTYYEVTFEYKNADYEYHISMKGKILNKDVEYDD